MLHFEYDDVLRSKMDLPAIVFHRECETAALRVSDTITDKKTRKEILESLLAAAQLGLGGPSPNLDEGKQYFEFFKLHVVRAAEDLRSLWVKEILEKSTYILIFAFLAIEFWAFASGLGGRGGARIQARRCLSRRSPECRHQDPGNSRLRRARRGRRSCAAGTSPTRISTG
jgi:hypothetical protein